LVTKQLESPEVGQVRRFQMLIDGKRVDDPSGATFESVNPFTGKVWAVVPEATNATVDLAVQAARRAFDSGPWGRMTGIERAALMRRLAELISENAEELAAIECADNGKLIREMLGQLKQLPEWYYYYSGAADKMRGEQIPTDQANMLVYTRREPIGVVAAIVPWNSPLMVLTYKLAPALAAGCTMVAKPAEQTPASTLEFARLFAEAGFPDGVFNVVTGFGPTTGRALVEHPGVDKVVFTGSTETGMDIMSVASKSVTPVLLELGGKSPNIVFADADESVTTGVVAGIFAAGGQTCVAGSRLFVEASMHDEMVAKLKAQAELIKLGDPMDMATEMGPIAFEEQLTKVQGYIALAQEEGSTLVSGGHRPTTPELRDGYFIEPTIFTRVDNDMRVAQEEIFGPVLAVIPFKTEEDVIRLANDTRYGLAAGIWTSDMRRAHRIAHALKVGTVWINAYRRSSYTVPFGGYKMSGIGREAGLEVMNEYTQTKAVWVELFGQSRDPFKST
jgi:(Z)-2-((N-methylformamido)methylene)-5-hydroxybutyrolactone dehydrogenase